jgi:hypothetical protein
VNAILPAYLRRVCVSGILNFILLTTKGTRFELDSSAILFGIAYNRGLFVKTLDEILQGDEKTLQTNPDVRKPGLTKSDFSDFNKVRCFPRDNLDELC